MIAAEGLVAIGRMIVAYRRGDGAATNYEIGWVTVALQHLRVGDNACARMSRLGLVTSQDDRIDLAAASSHPRCHTRSSGHA